MSKIYIIPDCHGRSFWRNILNVKLEPNDLVIFLGDYSDPYSNEGLYHEDALRELEDIVAFKKSNPEQVILLLGNHCESYITGEDQSTRYCYPMRHKYEEFYVKQNELFNSHFYIEIDNIPYLFIHAGITKAWVEQNKGFDAIFSEKGIDEALKYIYKNHQRSFQQYGRSRGGVYPSGGPMTADLIDHFGKEPAFPDLHMVMGHTQLKIDGHHMQNLHFFDCRKIFVLENHEFRLWQDTM